MAGELSEDKSKRQAEFDAWWNNYIARVNESVKAAEQYLEIPTGSIESIRTDPDFIAVVKAYAVIEPMLNDLLSARQPMRFGLLASTPNEDFQTFVAGLSISGRVGKLSLAKGLGVLTQDQVRFIEAVARVRNRYAHNVKNMHRSLVDILAEEQRNNAKIVEHVTGLVDVTLPEPDIAPLFKMFMYHRLADYLSDALKTLKPPPLPSGTVLGGLFGLNEAALNSKIDQLER